MKRFLPLIFILFIWFVFASSYFIRHNIPFPAKYQDSFFTPWNVYPQYEIPVKNDALSDVANELYPWKHFTIESLKKGQIPFWNPYSMSGTVHLANDQSAVLSPFNLLFFIFPFIDGWSLLILLQPLLAGCFMYLFLRSLRISQTGSLLGSIVFMFCGFMTVWMPYGTLSMAIAFLPLVLFAIQKADNGGAHNYSSLLIPIGIAISVFSGHLQISLYLLLYSLAFVVFRFFTTEKKKSFIWIFFFYLLGIAISLLQILPTLQAYTQSLRSNAFANSGASPLQYLITVIAPDFFGNPTTRNDWFGYYAEWSSFVGVIPFILAVIAIVSFFKSDISPSKKNQEAGIRKYGLFFFFAGIVALLLAINSSLQDMLSLLKLPVFSTSIPSRIIVLFSFSFCVLAGFGTDILREAFHTKKMKKIFFVLFSIALAMIVMWASIVIFRFMPKDKILLAAKNFVLPGGLFVLFLLTAGISYFLIGKSQVKKRPHPSLLLVGEGTVFILLLLTTVDSLRFATKWMPFDPVSFVYPSVPVIAAMQKDIGSGRVFGDFGAYIDTYYHLPSIEGYDPLYNQRYGEFISSAANGSLAEPEKKSIVQLPRRAKYADRVLDLLGVTLVYQQISSLYAPWAFPVWAEPNKYSVIYQDGKFQLYRNKAAIPRATLFYNYEVVPNAATEIKRFYNNKFDFRTTLLLETDASIPRCLPLSHRGCAGNGGVKIVSYTPNQVVISVTSARAGLLFLSDTYYPAWKATVNGKETKIYRADYAFRAVVVPDGKSTVKFYYRGML